MLGSRHLLSTANRRRWAGILVFMAVSVFSVNVVDQGQNFLSSVASLEKQVPFDGTVMPIQKVPDWVNLSSGQSALSYSELPSSKLITIPEYDNDVLTYPSEDLAWTASDKAIWNKKLTYPVAYTGNYELDDCGEGCGSHPAVDIKTLRGTPVHAIANGTIEEAGTSSSWGNYVVIKHTGVPSPDSPSQTTTLFSSYSHLDQIFVSEGKAVSKNAVIGEVGDTGTATTYHLHFQIDNASAPWYPYWPFTTAEARAAGYDFWDAVNHGVGLNNVYAYTENPMEFVQAHLDEDAVYDDEPAEDEDVNEVEEVEEDTEDNEPVVEGEDEDAVEGEDFSQILIEVPNVVAVGEQETLHFYLLDSNGDVIESLATFDGNVMVSVSDSNIGSLNRSNLDRYAFDDGEATLKLYGEREGSVTVTASFGGKSFTSPSFTVLDDTGTFDHLELSHDGSFVPGKAETVKVQAVDKEGNPVLIFDQYGTISLSVVQGKGRLEPNQVRNADFVNGVAEVSFIGDTDQTVLIRFNYGTKTGDSDPLVARLFNDLSEGDTSYEAVSYLVRQGTVQGYADGTFQPARTVSRVEALKFIFSGMDQSTGSSTTLKYTDTSRSDWYAKYLAEATRRGIVEGYSDGSFKPNQGVNRVEFLKMLFTTIDLEVDPVVVEDPYVDVDRLSWYAPYVQFSKEMNLFPISGTKFNASAPMSRLEVAEVIFRLITVLDNDETPYTSLQKPSDY